ncbi:MAG: hypothetical protein H6R19_608 [Proteobacteria bacterium]|nr:hypothetical protein [Pseudomonadota bacterium]
MNEHSKPEPLGTTTSLLDQIIGLDEHALRKSYYPQLQQQVEALRAAKGALEQQAAEMRTMLVELESTRKRAEESEANYRELFDKSSEAIIVLDPASQEICAVNQAFSELYGFSREEVDSLSILDLSSSNKPVDPAEVRQRLAQAMSCGTYRFEWLARRKNGSDFWADVTLKSASIRGERRILSTVRDITDRKRAEAEVAEINRQLEDRVAQRTSDLAQANQELATLLGHLRAAQTQLVQSEKLASLGALVAGIAHELNTPIGNCMMLASTLQDHRETFEKEIASGLRKSMLTSFLENITVGYDSLLRNLYRASELVTNFKELAVDQTSSRRRRFELHGFIHEIEVAQAPSIRKAACKLVNDTPGGIVLDSFPGPLSQVIGNLIGNAICHGFDGRAGGEIRITAEQETPTQVSLTVADNGCGIAAENLPRIFDPFFTTKLGHGGSGLGLHIVYNLVTGALGGSIRAESPPGAGVRFVISLPLSAPVSQATE